MSFFSWLGLRRPSSRCSRTGDTRRRTCRLQVERLEDRAVPASYSAANVPELIAAMNAANLTAEADMIALAAGATFTLTEVNNTANGPTGLPTIAANSGGLAILGNGGVIERSTATGTPAFRLFDVAIGASLRLEDVTLQGGIANASSAGWWVGAGGAIYNQGVLTLTGVTVQNNRAESPVVAQGGGIYSSGALTLENSSIQSNQAIGLPGMDADCDYYGCSPASHGGSAYGGGLYVRGSTALLTGVTISANTAQGGDGGDAPRRNPAGNGGHGLGGGLYAADRTITLSNISVTRNVAEGGAAGRGADASAGLGIGGGLYIDDDILAVLDAFTASNVKRNKASTTDPNIHGPYTVG